MEQNKVQIIKKHVELCGTKVLLHSIQNDVAIIQKKNTTYGVPVKELNPMDLAVAMGSQNLGTL